MPLGISRGLLYHLREVRAYFQKDFGFLRDRLGCCPVACRNDRRPYVCRSAGLRVRRPALSPPVPSRGRRISGGSAFRHAGPPIRPCISGCSGPCVTAGGWNRLSVPAPGWAQYLLAQQPQDIPGDHAQIQNMLIGRKFAG